MATLEQIAAALAKADAAGNVEDARALANAYRQMQGQGATAPVNADPGFDPMRDLPIPGTSHPGTPTEPSMVPWLDPVSAFANAAVDAVPIAGPTLTNMRQNLDAVTNSLVTGEPYDFDRSWQQQAGFDAGLATSHPTANTAGTIAGAVGPLLKAGTTQAGGQALGMTGPTAQRMLAGGASGAALTGADAAARGGDPVAAALMGGGLGAAFPLAERAISPVLRALMGQSVPAPVQSLGRNLERDGIDIATLLGQMDQIGPDAMLMDLGPNMTRQAGAIASLPGEGQTVLRDALVARNAGSNARIQGDVNATLGPATSPRAYNQGIDEAQRALSPLYETAFEGAKAVDTSPIALNLDSAAVNLRGEAQNVARSLRDMLNVAGASDVLDPNPRTLFEIRKAIDGMFTTVQDGNARRLLSETRRLVDDELAAKVPGIKDADAQFRTLAETRGAFEQGQQALDSGRTAMTPADLAATTAGSPAHVLDAMSQGTRAEIDRIIGTTGNNITALKSALKGDGSWNRERLSTLFGQDKADDLLNILEREQTYQRAYNTVLTNSETAARTAAQKEAAPSQFGSTSTSIADLLLKIPQMAANTAARGRSESMNEQIARLLIDRPSPEIVDQLIAARKTNRGIVGAAPVPLLTNQ